MTTAATFQGNNASAVNEQRIARFRGHSYRTHHPALGVPAIRRSGRARAGIGAMACTGARVKPAVSPGCLCLLPAVGVPDERRWAAVLRGCSVLLRRRRLGLAVQPIFRRRGHRVGSQFPATNPGRDGSPRHRRSHSRQVLPLARRSRRNRNRSDRSRSSTRRTPQEPI